MRKSREKQGQTEKRERQRLSTLEPIKGEMMI